MKLREIAELLDAEVLAGEEFLEEEAFSACGSDMMSDVLACAKDQAVLLTGLVNPQVVRTAMMMDMHCIVFTRGKRPTPEIVELAKANYLTVMASNFRMFEACGTLYKNGLGCEGVQA